jgi:Cu-Zn family superoxide dismutase
MKLPALRIALVTSLVGTLAACASLGGGGQTARAKLEPASGSNVSGEVTFVQRGSKVIVTADIGGLRPGAEHGFHVHERGDCSSGDGMSTGGHFNPLGKPHAHGTADRHVGDMPNIVADFTGRAVYRAELDVMTVSPGPASIVGKGLIVHRDPDDYRTQPTGNSGPRIACAVIRAD